MLESSDTALECKVGQHKAQRNAAVKDAQRWFRQSDCWNAASLCYPKELAEPKENTLGQILENTEDLLMVRVNQGGTMNRWHQGSLAKLTKLANDIGEYETYGIADTPYNRCLTVIAIQVSLIFAQQEEG